MLNDKFRIDDAARDEEFHALGRGGAAADVSRVLADEFG
jgi:hypothetical protein